MSLNLASILEERARLSPEGVAFKWAGAEVTYGQLDRSSSQAAKLLEGLGLEPGDRLALMLPNVPEFATAYYGGLKAGGVIVPLPPVLSERETRGALLGSRPKVLVAHQASLGAARPAAESAGVPTVLEVGGSEPHSDYGAAVAACDPKPQKVVRDACDLAAILFSSGTTGRPKAAALTHSNLVWNALVASAAVELDSQDVLIAVLPLFHSFGQTAILNGGIHCGAELVL